MRSNRVLTKTELENGNGRGVSVPVQTVAISDPPVKLLTVAETAPQVGVERDTLYTWCRNGEFPHYRLGSGKKQRILISWAQIQAYLRSHEVRPFDLEAEKPL